MQKKSIAISYSVLSSPSELGKEDSGLFMAALKALETAYAPYSKFRVGSAVLLADGSVISGSNQENIAYPSGLCAERVALFAAAANHPGKSIMAIAVVVKPINENEELTISPCGACRQVILEYQRLQKNPIRLIMGMEGGEVTILEDAKSLLPLAFYDSGLSQS
jgi:cytidine deaminase